MGVRRATGLLTLAILLATGSGACDPGGLSSRPVAVTGPPDGATTVRLCNVADREGAGRSDLSLQPPRDALIGDVQGLVDLVNALPAASADEACGGVGAPVSGFWFGYADGREYVVEYPNGGCWTLVGPGDLRDDGDRLQTAFVAALRAQRTTRTPPPPARPPLPPARAGVLRGGRGE